MVDMTFLHPAFICSIWALACRPSSAAANAVPVIATSVCPTARSNATHIVWQEPLAISGRRTTEQRGICIIQTRQQAEAECLKYLRSNLMAFDEAFLQTLGFAVDDDASGGVDGLDSGLIGPTVTLALDAKVKYPWTDVLDKDLFFNYVLNYANFNEPRTNWRPLLTEVLNFTSTDLWYEEYSQGVSSNVNVSSIVTWVNSVLWTRLARDPSRPIFFQSGQTPLIFDPMSVIAYGYASCTGVSILLSNALRSVGIAARVVGTPAWWGDASKGNHNWVEVYNPATRKWGFLEGSPATGGTVDTLEKSPCSRWYCSPDRYPSSKVFAAKMTKSSTCPHVPLAWEVDCHDVPGEDRTGYYATICGQCS